MNSESSVEPRTIPLPPPPENLFEADDRLLCETLFMYWLELNAGPQSKWPMPLKIKERIRRSTIGLESRVTDRLVNIPIASALSLTAQGSYAKAASLWRQIKEQDKSFGRQRQVAQKLSAMERQVSERRKKGGGSPKERRPKKYLDDVAAFVIQSMKHAGIPITKMNFRSELQRSLNTQKTAFEKGKVAKWPWIADDGKPRACPRQTIHDYVNGRFSEREGAARLKES